MGIDEIMLMMSMEMRPDNFQMDAVHLPICIVALRPTSKQQNYLQGQEICAYFGPCSIKMKRSSDGMLSVMTLVNSLVLIPTNPHKIRH